MGLLLFCWPALLGSSFRNEAAPASQFLYLSTERIVTVELVDAHRAILNYINLGDTFVMLEAPMLVFLDAGGRAAHGHVIRVEDPPKPEELYRYSELVPPSEYGGYDILGNYQLAEPIRRALLRVGGHILELEALDSHDFDLAAARISAMDMEISDRREMLLRAGFEEGHGTAYRLGSAESEPLERYFPEREVLPPLLVKQPKPHLPSAFSTLKDPVVVQLRAIISRAGGVTRIEVVSGLDPKLDQLAIDTIRNSWSFLPAVSHGRVSAAELVLNVRFSR